MSELSTRLHLRRKELGLSQEELAQRMGYRSKSSITKLEKGINDLPQSKVEELAAALETTPAYLLGLDTPCPCIFLCIISFGMPGQADHHRRCFSCHSEYRKYGVPLLQQSCPQPDGELPEDFPDSRR